MCVEALLEAHPDATRVDLPVEAYLVRLELPAFTDERLLFPVHERHAILVNATHGFDIDLAMQMFECISRNSYTPSESGAISVIAQPIAPFDSVVCVPPPTPRQFNGISPHLADITTWILPAYACEFRNGQSGDDFYNLAFRRPKIPVFNWDRESQPQLHVQLINEWQGGMYRKLKKPFVDSLASVSTAVGALPPDVRLRIIDIWDREVVIESAGENIDYVLTDNQGTSSGSFPTEDSLQVIRDFGCGKTTAVAAYNNLGFEAGGSGL